MFVLFLFGQKIWERGGRRSSFYVFVKLLMHGLNIHWNWELNAIWKNVLNFLIFKNFVQKRVFCVDFRLNLLNKYLWFVELGFWWKFLRIRRNKCINWITQRVSINLKKFELSFLPLWKRKGHVNQSKM